MSTLIPTGFSKQFKWGSSTNAQQFEGGYKEDGKGLSIADVRQAVGPTVSETDQAAGFDDFKAASDHYHRFKEDIALYGEMGFQIYRFTMAWTRIFPNGDEAKPNQAGLDYYDAMITELEKYHIEPVVTLYAYDLPVHLLEKYNGWMDRQVITDYLHYVKTVVTYFKGRVKYWVPFNEQNFLPLDSHYMAGYHAKNNTEIFRMQHHFNLSYAQATVLVHQIDPDAQVGGNIGNICAYPMTADPKDVELTDELMKKVGYGPADVYFRGKYSPFYLKAFPEADFDQAIQVGDLDLIAKAEPDFMSLTYYMSSAISAASFNPNNGMNGIKAPNPYLEKSEWDWTIDPYGFKHYLEDFYNRYQLPILILENGLGARDTLTANGQVNDDYRINYLADHIERMREAVEDGVKLIGYLTWSATDLYSTREGFEKRYGFVYVDKQDQLKRIKKQSFYWYQHVIETNGQDLTH
ncbi:glycoside hydrolase family 1 protein [Lactiplantibacillus plantarum]|uniref:glycoside hydrolase family 1 protein n=1 Tax=Lactiplantibacillus plantarum TaxID=1590 RepID=UPI001BAB8414|nr:glycoside hydrolase family 1 protein [Lactiplantibacillus plantarum]MBS0945560.1 glycoside hydrolase family 1 protein [Lactiplantibacillus plantarum]